MAIKTKAETIIEKALASAQAARNSANARAARARKEGRGIEAAILRAEAAVADREATRAARDLRTLRAG